DFFFFQAEDGIRVFHVTGVQTCALPILPKNPAKDDSRHSFGEVGFQAGTNSSDEAYLGLGGSHGELRIYRNPDDTRFGTHTSVRSEERRVGKEKKSRKAPKHAKKDKR